jgi:hypothetical protein
MHSNHRGSLSSLEAQSLHEKDLLRQARRWGYLPVIAGGAPTSTADAFTNPLTAPTVSGTNVTVDVLLNNPTIVSREVADMVMRNFFLDKVFDVGGSVTGGAVIYTQASVIDVYTDRDIERVQPGAEFPIVTGARIGPLVAAVEKYGGKFPVTDEAKRRNDPSRVTNQVRRLANTITRKIQQRGLAELEAAITAFSRTTAAATTWKAAAEEAQLNRVALKSPLTPLLKAMELMEVLEMGYEFNTLITNPSDAYYLRAFFGEQGKVSAALADLGIENLVVTPRKTAKSVILTAGKQGGQMRMETPMTTVTEREGAPLLRDQTWIQTEINAAVFVTDPYAMLEITAID